MNFTFDVICFRGATVDFNLFIRLLALKIYSSMNILSYSTIYYVAPHKIQFKSIPFISPHLSIVEYCESNLESLSFVPVLNFILIYSYHLLLHLLNITASITIILWVCDSLHHLQLLYHNSILLIEIENWIFNINETLKIIDYETMTLVFLRFCRWNENVGWQFLRNTWEWVLITVCCYIDTIGLVLLYLVLVYVAGTVFYINSCSLAYFCDGIIFDGHSFWVILNRLYIY